MPTKKNKGRAVVWTAMAALATLGGTPVSAWSAATVDGMVFQITPAPGTSGTLNPGAPLGLPTSDVYVGFDNAAGTLTLDGGTVASFRSLTMAGIGGLTTGPIPGISRLFVEGSATTLNVQRLSTGWGESDIFVRNGATLDARSSGCVDNSFNFFFCSTVIGALAGTTSGLEISGAGSRFLGRSVTIATGQASPLVNASGGGESNGQARAGVDVLNGASARSWNVTVGGQTTSTAFGTQSSYGLLQIIGAGSLWTLDGYQPAAEGQAPGGFTQAAYLIAGAGARATGQVEVREGGRLQVDGLQNTAGSFVILGNVGGTGQMTVNGAGSTVAFADGKAGAVTVGRGGGSQGKLTVENGGSVLGLQVLNIGRAVWTAATQTAAAIFSSNATGTVVVDGATSRIVVDRPSLGASPATVGVVSIAQGGAAQGTLTVRNGGQVQVAGQVGSGLGPALFVGRESGESGAPTAFTGRGTLNIDGPGSNVWLRAQAVTGGLNPLVRIGRTGTGTGELNITNGGQLIVVGQNTGGTQNTTTVFIGGNGNGLSAGTVLTGGVGRAVVDGAGSALRMIGTDRYLAVGFGNGADGSLAVRNGGLVVGTRLDVGRVGTTGTALGTLTVNGGTVDLGGTFRTTTGAVQGPSLNVGVDAGATGSMVMANSSAVRLTGDAAAPATVRIGSGFGSAPGGVGTVTMSTGSTLEALGAGSSIRVGEGGTGTLVVNQSTVRAESIVIGTGGYLGGNGTLVGAVTNYGTINAGNSPGTLVINGAFSNVGGTIVLEVQSDGMGGFVTDRLIFGNPSQVNLGGTAITFSFLAGTDPTAFQNKGLFNLNTFFAQGDASGSTALDPTAFSGISSFSATASPGYTFGDLALGTGGGIAGQVTAVPEPATVALMLAGLAVVGGAARRRERVGRSGLARPAVGAVAISHTA